MICQREEIFFSCIAIDFFICFSCCWSFEFKRVILLFCALFQHVFILVGTATPKKALVTCHEVDAKLTDGTFVAMFPLAKDKKKLSSPCYEFFKLLYEKIETDDEIDWKRVPCWFQCSGCNKLMNINPANGNAQMRKHGCYKRFKQQKADAAADESAARQYTNVDVELLAQTFGKFATIVFERGPVATADVLKSMPAGTTEEDW